MIQRRQTVFLLVAALLHTALYFLPIWTGALLVDGVNQVQATVRLLGVEVINSGEMETTPSALAAYTLPLAIANFMIDMVCTAAIAMFKNRKLQLRLVRFATGMQVALIVLIFVIISQAKTLLGGEAIIDRYEIGAFLPLAALLCTLLAAKGIAGDEALVQSSDRLR